MTLKRIPEGTTFVPATPDQEKRLSFDAPGLTVQDREKADLQTRCALMKQAVEEARLRAEAAEAYEKGVTFASSGSLGASSPLTVSQAVGKWCKKAERPESCVRLAEALARLESRGALKTVESDSSSEEALPCPDLHPESYARFHAIDTSFSVEGGLKQLGNVDELRKQLAAERNQLRLWIIKAKQDWEERKGHRGETNEQEYYIASIGETLGPNRDYQAEANIGKGVFSSVFRCKHVGTKTDVALKFVRSNKMMRKAAEKEVETYRKLAKVAAKEDHEGAQYIMLLAPPETFDHQGHLCLVFDLLKCDLRTALTKYGQGKGLPLQTVAQYARQLFLALRCLRKIKLIHGDLKPDNVLITLSKTEIKLCDFGSAMDVGEAVKTPYLQPRFYRAPEVILGSGYDTQIDLWSSGVTLFELSCGKILFTGKSNNSMVRQMLEVSGAFPKRLATKGEFHAKHFNSEGEFLLHDPTSITGIRDILPMKRYEKVRQPVGNMLDQVFKNPPPNSDPKTQERLMPRVADLVAKLLVLDPAERLTPEDALAHPFFQKDK
ncbi:Prpf4b [Symbiodinium natans]|uniref:Prpf4b protein n=1 Tax=Symbiodinium natans TaxID=878477 RepID=A0A812KC33_9DINO|nr:Prpf4b [Symbiodinium natans]